MLRGPVYPETRESPSYVDLVNKRATIECYYTSVGSTRIQISHGVVPRLTFAIQRESSPDDWLDGTSDT